MFRYRTRQRQIADGRSSASFLLGSRVRSCRLVRDCARLSIQHRRGTRAPADEACRRWCSAGGLLIGWRWA